MTSILSYGIFIEHYEVKHMNAYFVHNTSCNMHLQNICEFVFHADFVPFIKIQLYSQLAIFDVSQNKTCPKTRLLQRIMK